MKFDPLISILVPVYNHEKFIGDTINSVINQTYQNWEMLIVDDCSIDGSWDIIQEYAKKDNRIKAFRNEFNKGLILNWKFLIDNSKGECIAFLEGDDLFHKDNLKKKTEIFEKYPEVEMVYCNFKVISENGEILIEDNFKKNKIRLYQNEKILPEDFIFARNAPLSSYSQVMIKRDIVSVSGYPRSLDLKEKIFLPSDWDFNFRISTKNKIYALDEILLRYRKHLNNNSSNTIKVSAQIEMILDEYESNFCNDIAVSQAIRYMRGKTKYFNILHYIENGRKKEARSEAWKYVRNYPSNLIRDTYLNAKLLVRLFLPQKINAIITNKYYGK